MKVHPSVSGRGMGVRMHLQGRVGLRLREAVLRGRRLCLSPMTKWVVIPEARVWQPASCPAPLPAGLEQLSPKPYPNPPSPFHSPATYPICSASLESGWVGLAAGLGVLGFLTGVHDFFSLFLGHI